MKGKVVQVFFLLLTLIITAGLYKNVFAKEDGAPSGNTGSPGDDNQTCAHVDCHTGSASERDGLITTDVPASGYLSTETYLITVTISEDSIEKFGFQASPQDLDGSKMGEIELIDVAQTKETGGGKYITHTLSGTAGENTKTWTFNWIPDDASGDVTFYVAVNATNNDEHATGDKIFTSSVTIKEDSANIPVTLEELNRISFDMISPASEELLLIIATPVNSPMQIEIFDLSGKGISINEYEYSNGSFSIPIENLNSGIYFLRVSNDKGKLTKQFMKS